MLRLVTEVAVLGCPCALKLLEMLTRQQPVLPAALVWGNAVQLRKPAYPVTAEVTLFFYFRRGHGSTKRCPLSLGGVFSCTIAIVASHSDSAVRTAIE